MKNLSIYACTAVLGVTALALNVVNRHPQEASTGNAASRLSGDAAYRDGLYQSKLDAEAGRKSHLTPGRWTSEQNRRSFVQGYLAGRSQLRTIAATANEGTTSATAERMGYREGIAHGAQDLQSCQPFHLWNKDNPQAAAGYLQKDGNQDLYKQLYRAAYAEGYQEAYYGGPDVCSR